MDQDLGKLGHMLKYTLLVFACLLLWGWHAGKKRKGEFDEPVALPAKSLVEIRAVSDQLEKNSLNMTSRPQQQEAQDFLCASFYNGSSYTLTEMECEFHNETTGYRENFTLRPVSGKWLNRNGFKKYYADPQGIHLWSGDFGGSLNPKDRLNIKILSAYGFKP